MLRAKRTLYSEGSSTATVETQPVMVQIKFGLTRKDSNSDIDAQNSDSGRKKKTTGRLRCNNKKDKKEQKAEADSEIIVTTSEVHVDISNLDTRDLLIEVLSQMQNIFSVLGRKTELLEANLEDKLTDKLTKVLDKRVNVETTKREE